MRRIHVNASREYDILIRSGLLSQTGNILQGLFCAGRQPGSSGMTAAVISDTVVSPLYEKTVAASLREAGFRTVSFSFPAGEASKNISTFSDILNFLAENHLTRGDFLVALGGGVTGDLAGFAAASYLRGISYVQIPTTLLAMVDSSVGGKTAIDLRSGKNLAGAFWQPSLVLCDPDCLASLPPAVLSDGFAEVVKYAMIGNRELLELLETRDQCADPLFFEKVIASCAASKAALVREDEFDRGSRRLLNFGHTFGHAIEAVSGFEVSHGKAVAAGMAVMTRAAVQTGLCCKEALDSLLVLLKKYGLPACVEDLACGGMFSAESLCAAALSDKKIQGGRICLVIPDGLSSCCMIDAAAEDLKLWLAAGGVR